RERQSQCDQSLFGESQPHWQRRTNVWREVTSPARGRKRLRSYDARGLYPGSATRQSTSTRHSLTGKLECVHLGARAALADLIARAASCDYPSAVRSSVQRTLRLTASVATIADGNARSMPRDRN